MIHVWNGMKNKAAVRSSQEHLAICAFCNTKERGILVLRVLEHNNNTKIWEMKKKYIIVF